MLVYLHRISTFLSLSTLAFSLDAAPTAEPTALRRLRKATVCNLLPERACFPTKLMSVSERPVIGVQC